MRKLMKFLARKIPRQTLIKFSYIFSWLILPFYRGKNVRCPICGHQFRKFLAYGQVGADNRLCPKCLSLERHRLLWLFLQEKTDFFTANLKVLHIAPEQPFLKHFKALKNLDYTTGDLDSPIADIKVDIMKMDFEDNTFDVFICNHVLEHVDNDIEAMKEIRRVLKPGGWAILLVPINPDFETTYEDKNITSEEDREKYFGQYDHVRWHGMDYPKRLEQAGFRVNQDQLFYELPEEKREYYRLHKKGEEIIYQCFK